MPTDSAKSGRECAHSVPKFAEPALLVVILNTVLVQPGPNLLRLLSRRLSVRANSYYATMPATKIHARQIIDSRGNPTVEAEITTEKGENSIECEGPRGISKTFSGEKRKHINWHAAWSDWRGDALGKHARPKKTERLRC